MGLVPAAVLLPQWLRSLRVQQSSGNGTHGASEMMNDNEPEFYEFTGDVLIRIEAKLEYLSERQDALATAFKEIAAAIDRIEDTLDPTPRLQGWNK